MKKLIITTIILLSAVIAMTVIYFKNLNTTAAHTTKVMQSIPNTAALVFEFSNDAGFYDIFSNDELLADLAGRQKIDDLAALRQQLLLTPLLKNYFEGQHIYLSLHGQATDSINFLVTIAGTPLFSNTHITELPKQSKGKLSITPANIDGKEAYTIHLNDINKNFYVVDRGNHVFSGSFSKDLAQQAAQYQPAKNADNFLAIPDQQNTSSLANLYINYEQLNPLFDMFFKAPNNGILKSLRMMPALGALTLNYKTDALMFNGYTNIQPNKPLSYVTLFRKQQPVLGTLADLLPSTTAMSTCFALSDVKKFMSDLDEFHSKAGLAAEKKDLFSKIKSETGEPLISEFGKQLSGEFAVLTTKFDEKFAIVALKNGAAMRPLMVNISNMASDDVGQFKYNKVPFFLLGDAFSMFNHPYFIILNNYLILANSQNELNSYKDSYQNHKFLNKTTGYTEFDNLLAERSNVAYFLQFRNLFPLLKRDMKPSFSALFDPESKKGNKFFGLSWQLSAADNNFYTNFCMRLRIDTTHLSNN